MIYEDEDEELTFRDGFVFGSKTRLKRFAPDVRKYVYCHECQFAEKIPGKEWHERQYKCTKYNMICYSNNCCKAGVKK